MDKNILVLSKLTEVERLEIATLLIKAGYTVRQKKEKTAGSRVNNYYIEYWKGDDEDENNNY